MAHAVAISAPSPFMLISGSPASQEQCVVATGKGVTAKPCIDAIVAGQGAEIFASSKAGELQLADGQCLGIVADQAALLECQDGQGKWDITQVKQGNTCLVLAGSSVAAADCNDAAATGADKFFQVTVPAYDTAAPVAVKEIGMLLRASVRRQRALVASLQRLVPKLGSCKRVSFAVRQN